MIKQKIDKQAIHNVIHIIVAIVFSIALIHVIKKLDNIKVIPTKEVVNTIHYDTLTLDVITYSSVEEQCNSQPKVTSCGYKITNDSVRICAIPRTLLYAGVLHYGDTLYISNIGTLSGTWVVKDLLSQRIFNRVDLHIPKDSKMHNLYRNAVIVYKHVN